MCDDLSCQQQGIQAKITDIKVKSVFPSVANKHPHITAVAAAWTYINRFTLVIPNYWQTLISILLLEIQ